MFSRSANPSVVTKPTLAPVRVSNALVPRVVPSQTWQSGKGRENGTPIIRRMATTGACTPASSSIPRPNSALAESTGGEIANVWLPSDDKNDSTVCEETVWPPASTKRKVTPFQNPSSASSKLSETTTLADSKSTIVPLVNPLLSTFD